MRRRTICIESAPCRTARRCTTACWRRSRPLTTTGLQKHLRMNTVRPARRFRSTARASRDVYFPNGGVFSVTNQMRDGALVEVATVGTRACSGSASFFGDRSGAGRTFQQVRNGLLPSMAVARFIKEIAVPGPFREVVGLYAQANLLQIMQSTACNALHDVRQRCCRWLLQTHDRVESDEFHGSNRSFSPSCSACAVPRSPS